MRFRRSNRRVSEERGGDGGRDSALVAAAQAAADDFDPLFRRYWDEIVRFCYFRLGDLQEAEDAAIQVFFDAYAALARFNDRGDSFRPWLYVIARNEISDRRLRLRVSREVSIDAAGTLGAPGPTPEELALTHAALSEARGVLVQLPERLREVAELWLAGLADREIAEVLGIRHDAVRQAKSRAIVRLRELLGVTAAPKGGQHV